MKTPEELAEEYTKDWWGSLPEAEGMRKSARENFLAGYQAAAPQWISVNERLPDDGKEVLGIVYNDIRLGWIDLITTDPGQFHWVSSGIYIDKGHYALTHWMPLPEAPKEER